MAELGLEARPASYQNPVSNTLGREVGQETACGPALTVWGPSVATAQAPSQAAASLESRALFVRLCRHLVVMPQHPGACFQHRRGRTIHSPTVVYGPVPWELGFESCFHHPHFKISIWTLSISEP